MKKFLAVLLAMVMTVSLVACGGTQPGNENPTPEPTSEPTKAPDTVTDEISIDFEDGNFGFAMMKTRPRKADESVLSVTEVNGSKALYVKHVEAAEMHLGIDIDAILGEKVTEVRKITMTLGTEHGDAKFASAAGELLVYTGDQLVETKVSTWAVYMKNKNPKTVTIELPEGVAFTAGNDNYFVINKLEDTGSVISDFYIDDIRFYDANGNVLKGDTTVVMEAPANFLKRVEEEDDNTSAVKVAMDEAYGGDWGQSGIISAEVLSQFTSGVTITVKYELQSGYDYYLWGPMDSSWAKLGPAKIGMTAKAAAEEGDKYHAQDDGFIVIDDFTNTELTFTLSAETVAELVAGGGLSAQTYGVVAFEAVLTGETASVLKEKVAGEESYCGDWGQSAVVPADVLAKFAGDVTVTAKYELQSGYDYYLWGPMDSSWAKLGAAKIGMTAKAAAEEGDKYHVQDDGFIVIDDFTNTEITFTLPAAVVAELVASGGLSAQTYGVTVYEIVLEGKAPTMLKEKVAADEAYGGDWGQSGIVSADVLAKFGGDVTVTVKYELQSGYDYYLWGPMDSSWAKLGPAKIGMTAKAAAEEGDKYHVQDDGFIVIDDFTNTELTFTLPAAVVAELVASGGLSAQTYGVVAYELVLEGVEGGTSAPAEPTPDVPAEPTPDVPAEPVIDPTNDTIEGTVGYTGTYKMSDSTWWTQVSMTKADILGDVSADQVAGIKFTSDTKFVIGYNADANGTWKQYDSGNTYVVKTIELSDEAFGFCFALSKGDGVEYTITWEVYLKGEEASGDDILAEYVGDYGLGWSASVAELQALTGNVTLTFDVAYTGTVDYPQFTLIDQGDGWSKLKAEDFAANAPTINSYEFIEMFDPSVTSFTTTISADAIARIIANGGGLGVQVNGIVVRNAKLTAAE